VESVITDERMILSISTEQTTLYDQIQYSGAPSSFAWVLPIKGAVTVGLSADIMFNLIDQTLTASQVVEPPTDCPPAPVCTSYFSGGGSASFPSAADAGVGLVTVTMQEQVGPYETVQLHSNDGSALTSWLDSHGYAIAKDVVPVIAAYVADKFDFLALKLVPGAGVQSMQPVRVTSAGASISLPLRMVAVGTGATTGISIWVVGDGRWEPQNFPSFIIKDSEISWDWTTSSSNYETLRLSKEAALKGRGWQIESSIGFNQNLIRQDLGQIVQSLEFSPSPVGGYLAAGEGDGGSVQDGGEAGVADAGAPDSNSADSSAQADGNGDSGDGGIASGDDSGEEDAGNGQAAAAAQDLDVLFKGIAGPNVRITRMRSDVAHSALTNDMYLQASADQSELSNLHYPQNQIGQPQCPVYSSNCVQTGTLPRDQAIAAANGGCNATRGTGGSRTSILIALGLVGFGAFRVRRRRNRR
jgi:hypothetical protein